MNKTNNLTNYTSQELWNELIKRTMQNWGDPCCGMGLLPLLAQFLKTMELRKTLLEQEKELLKNEELFKEMILNEKEKPKTHE